MATHLKEGLKAPAFTGKDQDGNKISLSQFKGKKLALYFYPQDLTPTCTVQACNLRDNFSMLMEQGIQVVGVSPDDMSKHKKFIGRNELPFPLIADTSHEILEKYGVWGPKKMFGHSYMGVLRTTFLIDEKGKIKKIFLKPQSKRHAEEILEAFEV